jgi:hypothetical protein
MAVKLFGFKIGRDDEEKSDSVQSFAIPDNEEGALTLQSTFATGGAYGQYIDIEGAAKNEAELISRYREMIMYPECDLAVDDVVNEAIVFTDERPVTTLLLDKLKQPETIKTKIHAEFQEILRLLDFNNLAFDIFRRWYVDGRLYFHVMIDVDNPGKGIQELRPLDPRKIRKVREIKKGSTNIGNGEQAVITKDPTEYFVYNESGLETRTGTTLKIAKDSIVHAHSGLLDPRRKMVVSHLHKAIKPYNQLRMIEDAVVIYRIARAPERRIFYVDVGNLPKMKAEQYLRDTMTKFKNRLVYDANTGEVRDERQHKTMLEDYWLPRREGGRSTEITTLPGGQNLGEIEDLQYFQKKLYRSLNVPTSRLEADTGFSLGRSAEIQRDEVKFGKFVSRLRRRFSHVFYYALETQLRLKGIITGEDWETMKDEIQFDFAKDVHFQELNDAEILRNRVELLRDMEEFKGTYYSSDYLRRHVLKQTEDEITLIGQQMAKEAPPEEEEETAEAEV